MKLIEGLTLSQNQQKTYAQYPLFFGIVLNALFDNPLTQGYRKPELNVSRDEVSVICRHKNHSFEILFLVPNQIVITDSRLNSKERQKFIRSIPEEAFPKELPVFISDSLESIAELTKERG